MDHQPVARRVPESPPAARVGTAATEGPLWGRRARDWSAVQEPQLDAVYRDVLAKVEVTGRSVLDIGCGAGRFLQLAAAAGARVEGIDASQALIEEALWRVPGATIVRGEMQRLPFPDERFDLVTGFNSFQWAADRTVALSEAARVMRLDGRLLVATWGPPEVTDAAVYLAAIDRLMPPPPPGAPGSFALAQPAVLDAALTGAGLRPLEEHAVWSEWRYPDLTTALRGLLAAGPAARATALVGEAAMIDAVIGTLGAFRAPGGGFRLRNQVRWVLAARADRPDRAD